MILMKINQWKPECHYSLVDSLARQLCAWGCTSLMKRDMGELERAVADSFGVWEGLKSIEKGIRFLFCDSIMCLWDYLGSQGSTCCLPHSRPGELRRQRLPSPMPVKQVSIETGRCKSHLLGTHWSDLRGWWSNMLLPEHVSLVELTLVE